MANYNSRVERRNGNNKPKNKKKKSNKGLFKRIFLVIILLGLLLGLTGSIYVYSIVKDAPKLDPKALRDPLSTTIMDMNNKKATTIFSDQKRIYKPITQIPKIVQQAFISTEDVRFYHHFGIDLRGIARAALANITHGFGAQGASTITQQVVRNSVLTDNKTIPRKIQEMYLAIKLEQRYSKDQILEMYLNKIFLGEHAYGVATAAQTYFGKPLKDVTVSQAAMLAALPKAPSYYDPFNNPKAAQKRRNVVLDLMAKNHVITKSQADKAKAIPISKLLNKGDTTNNAQKYDAFVQEVHHELVDVKKVVTDDQFYKGGLTIYTTLDPKAQTATEDLLTSNKMGYPNKEFDAATALVDTKTGAIRAIGAGRKYRHFGDFNHATSKDNQIGSTAKPIMDYGPAIDYQQWSTGHPIVDDQHTYSSGKTIHNWDDKYYGPMNIRAALALSRNIPAVKVYQELLKTVGGDKISAFANKLGFTDPKKYSPNKIKETESYAIGSFSSSPLQMAAAYAAFGDKGIYHQPYTVRKIVFADGHEITLDHQEHPAMHEYTAYMVTDMLKSIFNMIWTTPSGARHTGTGITIAHDLNGLPVAAKTGTQNRGSGVSDEWMVGYTTQYSLGVWTGYDTNKNMTKYDEQFAKKIFAKLMTDVSNKNTPDFQMPNTVVKRTVEKSTGLLPSANTPKDQLTTELFVKGHEPTKVSNKYKKLDPPTNLQTQYDQATNQLTLSWDYPTKDGIVFDIGQKKKDNTYQSLGTTNKNQIIIKQLVPGNTYEFSVTAKYANQIKNPSGSSNNNNSVDNVDRSSDPAVIQVDIPQPGPGMNQGGPNGSGNGSNSGTNSGGTNGSGTSGQTNQGGTNSGGSTSNTGTGTSSGTQDGSNQNSGTTNNSATNNLLGSP